MGLPVNGIVYGTITFLPEKGFATWYVTHETAATESTARQSREGTSKSNTLKFSIPKDQPALRAMFDKACDDEFIVLYKDANGKQKVFGLPDAPVKFRYTHASGSATSSANAYEGEFYYEGPENMHFYNGTVTSAPAGTAPAVVRFNGVAIAVLQPGETLNITSEYSFTEYFTTSIT